MPYGFIAVFAAMLLLSGCAGIFPTPYNAVVGKPVAGTAAEKNSFATLQAALDAAPTINKKPYRIYIKPGDYYEKLVIAKPNIQLIGADKNTTRIFYNAYAGQQSTEPGATPGQIWGTTGSATLTVRAANIRLQQLTVENTFDFPGNDALASDHPKRIANTQAVALHLDNGSDRFIARDLRILGYQDTLFVNSGRSWFDKSLIAGTVDFIFGKGNALFTHSEIKTLGRGKASLPHGFLVAPSTNISSEYGLTFIDCILTRDKSVPDNSTPLGRPWHPTTQFTDGRYADPNAVGKAVFINSWMDAHIMLEGWYSMSGTARDGAKITFLPQDARFFEYNSRGPGAAVNRHRKQLTPIEAKKYIKANILDKWQHD